MNFHHGKRFLLGVSGGIAAYKSPMLARHLLRRGGEVRVMMTPAAEEFITPLTLQAVSGHPVHRHLLDAEAESGMGHIELARWAEQIIIAPATADCIARLAHGRADDLLCAVVLAADAADTEVAVAPAMNRLMWQNPATRRNLAILAERGVRVIGPDSGAQACGETGEGRMSEPEDIARLLAGDETPRLLAGRHALITAGPTWEALDPVRGITNRSSGKMGYAFARAARDFGARVTLVSGRVSLATPREVRRIDVSSAEEMLAAVTAHAPEADVFIAVAAVADYRPAAALEHKIKKAAGQRIRLDLLKNPDILASVAAMKGAPFTVGFAAESDNVIANARQKLKDKGADVIAANRVGGEDDALDGDHNAVTLLYQDGEKDGEIRLGKTDKYRLAVQIIQHIAPLLEQRRQSRTAQ